jgi:hypothetical protein
VIIFQEDDRCVFTPSEITSDFNHVFMVVREEFDYDIEGYSSRSNADGTTTTTTSSTHLRQSQTLADQRGDSQSNDVPRSGGSAVSASTTSTTSVADMVGRQRAGSHRIRLSGGSGVVAAAAATAAAAAAAEQQQNGKRMSERLKDKEKEKDFTEYNGGGGGSGLYGSGRVRSPMTGEGGGSGVRAAVKSPSSRSCGVNNSTARTRYRVAITQKEGVPPYGPLIAYPPVYEAVMPRFRSTILKKRTCGVLPRVMSCRVRGGTES